MKKTVAILLVLTMAFSLVGCSSGGISQEEYDKVVAERDALLAQIESMGVETDIGNDGTQEPTKTPEIQGQKAETGKFNEEDVLSKMEVKDLWYSNDYWNYAFLTIKNNSDFNVDVSASVKFYDEAGKLIGAQDADQKAVESGYSTILYFMPDEKFAKMEYELDVNETKRWDCVLSDLSYEAVEAKNKVILSVKNNGEEAAEFVQAYVLFFNGDNVVGFAQNYMTDDDSELKSGKTVSKEMDCYEYFDSYQVFLSGRK